MQFAVYVAYRLRLETAFMADECASATTAAVAAELRLSFSAEDARTPDEGAAAAAAAVELPVTSLLGEPEREGAANGGAFRPRAQAGAVVSGLAGALALSIQRSDSGTSMLDSLSRMQLSAPLTLLIGSSVELPGGLKGSSPAPSPRAAGPSQKAAATRKLVGEDRFITWSMYVPKGGFHWLLRAEHGP